MRKYLLITLFLISCVGYSQRDTIQVSVSKAVVIFPANISDVVMGNELEFYIESNKKAASQFSQRILKLYVNDLVVGKKTYSTLLVLTADGNSYEFILESEDNPKQPTYYISPDQAVTNILGKKISEKYQGSGETDKQKTSSDQPEIEESSEKDNSSTANSEKKETAIPTAEMYENDIEEYFRLRSYYMQFDKAKIPRYFARSGDVFLWLKGVYYNENEIYIQLKLENRESIDLDLKLLKFSIATSYKKSSSNQKTELDKDDIKFKYKVPKRVKGNSENHFVIVLKKITLDRSKVLVIDMDEESGNRNLSLEIDNGTLNNPFKIK